jgi:two-component system OmpR family response regulator
MRKRSFELAGRSRGVVEAEHPDRAGEHVRGALRLLPVALLEATLPERVRRVLDRGEALIDEGAPARPDGEHRVGVENRVGVRCACGDWTGECVERSVRSRLLLVDDAEDIRAIARLSLEQVGGWNVVSVASGSDALRVLREDGPFDVVLLDVMMPGMDGPATLARMRADGLQADTRVVFLTAKAQGADRRRLEALGAAGVIAKPFDPMILPRELERLLG